MPITGVPELAALAILAAVGAAGICLRAEAIARRLQVIDHPDQPRKAHRRSTPLVGGLALVAAVLPVQVLAVVWHGRIFEFAVVATVLLATAFILGFLDDRGGLSASLRLGALGLVAFALALWQPGLGLQIIYSGVFADTYDLWWLAIPLGAFAITGMANAVNMADGANGLVLGVSLIWAGLMAPWAVAHAPETLVLLAAVAAAAAVILPFNLRGRLFLGDGGSYTLGALFGALALYLYHQAGGAMPAELVALWFGALFVDVGRLSVVRLCQGCSPMRSDRQHLHHLLQSYMPDSTMRGVYWALVLVPGLLVTLDGRLLTPVVIGSMAVYAVLVGAGYAVAWRQQRVETQPARGLQHGHWRPVPPTRPWGWAAIRPLQATPKGKTAGLFNPAGWPRRAPEEEYASRFSSSDNADRQ